MLDKNLTKIIKNTVKLHRELHGNNGIVDYAIVNDVMRKEEFKNIDKKEVEDVVNLYFEF